MMELLPTYRRPCPGQCPGFPSQAAVPLSATGWPGLLSSQKRLRGSRAGLGPLVRLGRLGGSCKWLPSWTPSCRLWRHRLSLCFSAVADGLLGLDALSSLLDRFDAGLCSPPVNQVVVLRLLLWGKPFELSCCRLGSFLKAEQSRNGDNVGMLHAAC